MTMAEPADVRTARNGSSTRVEDFVNRGPEFDGIYIYPPLLAACRQIIGGRSKLSGMRGKTLHPGAGVEAHHVDVKYQDRANGWPLVGCILMVDAFDAENGVTRFVPGSHLQPHGPDGKPTAQTSAGSSSLQVPRAGKAISSPLPRWRARRCPPATVSMLAMGLLLGIVFARTRKRAGRTARLIGARTV